VGILVLAQLPSLPSNFMPFGKNLSYEMLSVSLLKLTLNRVMESNKQSCSKMPRRHAYIFTPVQNIQLGLNGSWMKILTQMGIHN